MAKAKYSDYLSSNGYITFKEDYNKAFNKTYTYLKIYNVCSDFKVYINNSSDYISVGQGEIFELKDFAINTLKIVPDVYSEVSRLQFILLD
ncbi:hypothetical protein [Clostridium cochlearium]|uniref:hypothetical protein n=1 Tax=Clostridium cochlearium TaxID=1494 RepID=UPI00156F76DC|nr:hypothetical protein [Clostridium cochlearium]MBV1819049.1 hypothetical protein [Bacteroidales bacterium MSK.15.36]MCG4580648.1 hypothetical protein [Clostridium cochlearium]NSJ91262.1 hypothetical protein [Coprococcus sp. MSK.21.13]